MKSKTNPRKKLINILVIVVVVVVVLYLAVCSYAAMEVTKTEVKDVEPTDVFEEYQEVRFPARNDGLEIAGWYIPNPESSSAIILVHGRKENRATAMEGTFPEFAAALNDAGFAVLMIDVRGHGESAPARYDFGLKSKNDVLGAVDWLLDQGFARGNIGALGVSLGGGTVNFAAVEEPAIGVVVTDSTYSDINPVIEALWQDVSGLPNFFLPGVYLMHQIIFRFDLRDAVPIDLISNMGERPVLVVHCKVDDTVPFNQARDLVETIQNVEYWYIEDGCEHAQIYTVMPEEYESHIIPFFQKNLP